MVRRSVKDVLISREKELNLLQAALQKALNHQSQFFLIKGESGKGKTTLVEYFLGSIPQTANLKKIIVRCEAETKMASFAPWIKVIRGLYDIDVHAIQTQRAQKARMREIFNLFVKVAPVWLDLVFQNIPSAILVSVDEFKKYFAKKPQDTALFSQENVYDQFTELIINRTNQGPVVIFIDDLQWIDQSSLHLLQHLRTRLTSLPFLFLCAYRPSLIDSNKEFTQILNEVIRLGASWLELTEGINVHAYLKTRYPHHDFPSSFIQEVQKRTDGDPLFVAQLFNLLEDQGKIVETGNKYHLFDADVATINIPYEVQAVIENRINALEDELRDILNVACVEGEDFTAEVIARVEELEEKKLIDDLTSLEKIHRLVVEGEAHPISFVRTLSLFRFTHSYLREYLYKKMPGIMQRRLHMYVADCLEELYGDQTEQIADRLAYHYLQANLNEKAATYSLTAAYNTFRNYGWLETTDLARQVFELLENDNNPETYQRLAKAALIWEESASHLDRYYEVIPSLKTCINLLKKRGDEELELLTKVLISLAHSYYWLDDPQAKSVALEAVELATRIGDLSLIFDAKYILKDILEDAEGKFRQSIQIVNELLVLSDELEDLGRKVDCLGMLAWDHIHLGGYEEAVQECFQALKLLSSQEEDNPILENMLHRFLGLAYYGLGQYEKALAYSGQAANGYISIGDKTKLACCQEEIGETYLEMRQYEKANQAFVESKLNAKNSTESWVNVDLASTSLAIGEISEAEQYLKMAEDTKNQSGADQGSKNDWIDLKLTWAKLFLAKGRFQKAILFINDAQQISTEVETDIFQLPIQYILGQVAQAQREYAKAEKSFKYVLDLSNERKLQTWKSRAIKSLADLHKELGEISTAWHEYQTAIRIFQDLEHNWELKEIFQNLIQVGMNLNQIHRLSRIYPFRHGRPALEYVDISIFKEKYFKDCLQCNFCHDSCCQYGVDVDVLNMRKISQHAVELEAYIGIQRSHWFTGRIVSDDDYPGGNFGRTQVIDNACVFLNREQRGCKLHSFCIDNGLDYHELKPFISSLFPLTFDHGLLHPCREVEEDELICSGEGYSLYRGVRDELAYYYGQELVSELDEFERKLST